ncbi:UNVERIFIED_CONTAM: hypothetical protein NCL1_53034 [Trichonephila clavipes]
MSFSPGISILPMSWLEIYSNLQFPKTPKSISDKVPYRFVTYYPCNLSFASPQIEEELYKNTTDDKLAHNFLFNTNKILEHRITLVDDNKGVPILEKLKRLSSSREIHLQWVPSHVNIAGNEIADSLVKDGSTQSTINSAPLIYSELHSTYTNNKQSTVPPAYHWYESKRPGSSLSLQCSRQEQTILTRLQSGHLQTLSIRDGDKEFFRLVSGVLPVMHLQNTFLTV